MLTSGPVDKDSRLVEMDWGSWEGRTVDDLRAETGRGDAGKMRIEDWIFRPAHGESPREVIHRVGPLIAEIGRSGRNTVAVTHKGVIRAIYAAALDWTCSVRPRTSSTGFLRTCSR